MLAIYAALHTFVTTRFTREEKGATAVEYGIMVALIAVVIIAAVATLGTELNTDFTAIVTRLGGTVTP